MFSKKLRTKLFVLIFGGALSLVLLIIGGYQLIMFLDSNAFCGKLCHTVMYPEYTAYQVSPHARVACVTCHVGPGVDFLVKSKIRGVPQIFYTLTGTYERPITTPVKNMRPARDTCETCHRPEEFVGDSVRFFTYYASDKQSTKTVVAKALRVGGGTGVPQDIHWHIASKVWYLPLDAKYQEIGWVGVENSDGTLSEWYDNSRISEITLERIQKEKRLMDCIDCHNRATHVFYSPEQLIDDALDRGLIDQSLPYVKKEAASALDPVNSSLQVANDKIDSIVEYYKTNYPSIYQQKTVAITNLITQLKKIAVLTTFPDMKVDWMTSPNNGGHQQSPGCFRCHGKLENQHASQGEIVIDARCNLCHYPVSLSANELPIVEIPHTIKDLSECLSCHARTSKWPETVSHAGRPNENCTSCHLVAGSSAPSIPHVTTDVIGSCSNCHGFNGIRPYPVSHSTYGNDICFICHASGSKIVPLTTISIPHNVAGYSDCLNCHSDLGKWPTSASHTGRTNATCTVCHAAHLNNNLVMHLPNMGSCTNCHSSSANWPYPSSHAVYTENICSLCHNANTIGAPQLPHSTEGRSNCLYCHGSAIQGGNGSATTVPNNHKNYPLSVCLVCHQE